VEVPDAGTGIGHREDQPTGAALAAVYAAVQIIPLAAVAHTASYEIVAANEACSALLKIPVEGIQGRLVRDFIPLSDRTPAKHLAMDLLQNADADAVGATGSTASSLRRLILDDGTAVTCWMHVGIAHIAGYRLFIACMDLVNPVLNDAHRWRQRADHDELTGLLRRGPLLDNVREWLAGEHQVVLAFLDVDGLKSVNDTHGHAAGDHILSVISRRLEQLTAPGALVARLSGDEFVLAKALRPDTAPDPTVQNFRGAAGRCVAEPIAWADHLLTISVSTGVVVSRPHEQTGTLLARADAAMYAEKGQRRA
jgi:diguanylate cyclase (GGDEF)-like protein